MTDTMHDPAAPAAASIRPLRAVLKEGRRLPADDLVHAMLGLMREVAALHAAGRVAQIALDTVIEREDGQLALADPAGLAPRGNLSAIHAVQPQASSALKLVGNYRVTQDEALGTKVDDLTVLDGDEAEPTHPAFITGLRNWESALGHHDEITDIFQLGMIMAALACGIDLEDHDDLKRFSMNRDNLFAIAPRLHPVIASLILEATELNRHERAKDVAELAQRLDTWRDQPAGIDVERVLASAQGVPGRRTAVLSHLRDRLFDLSRRNRLIHFRPTQSSINFTDASIPIVMRIESVRADALCTWKGAFAKDVLGGKAVPLNRWLRFEDQPQIPSQLDRIIQENRRNRNEYGFSSLRLTVAFLHWHNLKEAPEERISSPLLWLPVEVAKRKGVRDQYVLTCPDSVAEFNPALRHMLRQLYAIELPETVDLAQTPIEAVHEAIRRQIHDSEPGVRLELQERPAIRLILQRAVARVNKFNRRSGTRQTVSAKADFSYSREDYRPLGLALFEKFVKPDPLPQRIATGGGYTPKRELMVAETESLAYGKAGGEGHKFSWEIDCTCVTLANFNYKKMSLVRDYNALIDTPEVQPAFDQVFSIEPRPFVEDAPPPIPPAEQWGVVASDATQDQAVAFARTGRSYIIQGPPGTGKSQTITNLIADYAGQGKRVLFVCEKRAALDVVYHRLGQAGLDGLATIIHDAQDDKRGFIADLGEHYERWGRTPDGLEDARAARAQTVAALSEHLRQISDFEAAVGHADAASGAAPLRDLVRRAAALPAPPPGIGAAIRESLPPLAQWDAHRDTAARAFRAFGELAGAPNLAAHPFARLKAELLLGERPYARIEAALADMAGHLERLDPLFADEGAPLSGETPLAEAHDAVMLARQLVETGLVRWPGLFDPASPESQTLRSDMAAITALENAETAAAQAAAGWRDPLGPADTAAALELARAKEGSLFAVFSGAWRTLKATVRARYDFAAHAVAPKVTAVLEQLAALHQARSTLDAARAALAQRLGTPDLAALLALHARLDDHAAAPPSARMLDLARTGEGQAALARLAQLAPTIATLGQTSAELFDQPESLTLDGLGEVLRDLQESLDDLPDLLPHLTPVLAAPPAVAAALTRLPLPLSGIEALIVDEAIASRERAHPDIRRFDIERMIALSRRSAAAREMLRDQNAAAIRATLHRQFRDNVRISETSVTQLDTAGRELKRVYANGRRELEHEFGKTMRYKSIREIASADSGRVVADLKPVWLMSPLSVSDTLPLQPDLFDVVIFDEASQVPTEDAVPALCRARQVVIVGDEMQLPPTSFFSAAQSDDEMEVLAEEEDGTRIAIVLDADSLLAQAARNLPATLLAWHYRSRFEALISFSNAAFYAGELVTIPDRSLRLQSVTGGAVESGDDAAWAAGADRLLAAPITTHRMADGVYDRRANLPEARYIAGVVRELLRRDTGLSIGIVAFSEAQQSEIEDALERLAAEDEAFSTLLTREVEREEDGQFTGLFVKNLENVQGDERDIILMSVCYAPGPDGRMAMNFGPINQRGGEKRLNVIFSRAKRHMAIVSTIAPEAITNVHNDGARALRSFLAYAEAQSAGAQDKAQAVLATLNPDAARTFDGQLPPDPVRSSLAAALRARGHEVHEHVGGASFRCDLAVVDPEGGGYRLAVLLDRAGTGDAAIEERFVFRPVILRAFGWRVLDVPVSSWLRNRAGVVERIEQELSRSSWDLADPDPLAGTGITATAPAPGVVQPFADQPQADEAPVFDVAETPAAASAGMTEFRLVAGTSNKFWRVGVFGTDLIVEFGRVGTKGQRVVKSYEEPERARREATKLTLEKTRKGYEEFG